MTVKHEFGFGMLGILAIAAYVFFVVNQYNASSIQPSSAGVTLAEVANHNTPEDCWIVIQNKAYAVSIYLSSHPGGEDKILPYCGKDDAAGAFATKNKGKPHSDEAHQLLESFYVGDVQ